MIKLASVFIFILLIPLLNAYEYDNPRLPKLNTVSEVTQNVNITTISSSGGGSTAGAPPYLYNNSNTIFFNGTLLDSKVNRSGDTLVGSLLFYGDVGILLNQSSSYFSEIGGQPILYSPITLEISSSQLLQFIGNFTFNSFGQFSERVAFNKNITAPNVCYSDGTNCTSSGGGSTYFKPVVDIEVHMLPLAATTTVYDPIAAAGISSGTSLAKAGNAKHIGIHALRDSTTANGGFRIMTDVLTVLMNENESSIFIFNISNTRTTRQFRMGYQDSVTVALGTDGCFIEVNGTHWAVGRCRSNSVETNTSSRVLLKANEWYVARIDVVNVTYVNFTIYNQTDQSFTWNDKIVTNIPTGEGRQTGWGIVGTESTTDAAADIVEIDYMRYIVNRSVYGI